MRQILNLLFKKQEKRMAKREDFENQAFLKVAEKELRELAKKGLSIPVFTL